MSETTTEDRACSAAGGLFIMPRAPQEWAGGEALWVTVAGWARAASKRWGHSSILTPQGWMTADEALAGVAPSQRPASSTSRSSRASLARTAAKDLRSFMRSRSRKEALMRHASKAVPHRLVWQQHDLFLGAGRRLARSYGAPWVLYVHAPIVWEARRWGVQRPGWGHLIEFADEAKSFRSADLICCVSEEVAEKISTFGVEERRILVSPMSVDSDKYAPSSDAIAARSNLDLAEDDFVIGWVGTFRPFHGLETAIRAFASLRGRDMARPTKLLLVGDGPERARLQELMHALGLQRDVIFTGRLQPSDVPDVIECFDAGIVTAANGERFHYSPLKLREYASMGVPVVVPSVGELPRIVDESWGLLYRWDSFEDLAEKLALLSASPAMAGRMGEAGREIAMSRYTWDVQLASAAERLRALGWPLP